MNSHVGWVWLGFLMMAVPGGLWGQSVAKPNTPSVPGAEPRTYHLRRATGPIQVDGQLNEATWQSVDVAQDFWMVYPYDTARSRSRTYVRLTYDAQYLYVGVVCHDSIPLCYVATSLRRDFSYPINDAFGVNIDPTGDHNYGFNFTISPLGVQREGLISNGGNFGVNTRWDNRWLSAVSCTDTAWVAELAIPFKTLRYKPNLRQWSINFTRNDLQRNESSAWVGMPRNFNVATLAYTGTLDWDTLPPPPGRNIALIPYLSGRIIEQYRGETSTASALRPWDVGLDAKIGITPALNLDLTFNADFAQVDVDRQVINLDRFPLFFPEQRFFFLENYDLFSTFGFSRIRPFFTRRIGLFRGSTVPILGGARLSGKLTPDWRLGFMNLQTEGVGALGLPGQNYTVLTSQYQVGSSNLSAIWVNRQGFDGTRANPEDFSRIVGADYNIFSKDNRLRGKLFYHHSFGPRPTRHMGATALWLRYQDPRWLLEHNHEYVGRNYLADVGFVPRLGYIRLEPIAQHNRYPKSGPIRKHGPRLYNDFYFSEDGRQLNDRTVQPGWYVEFQDNSNAQLTYEETFIRLTFPFDPSNTGQERLPEGVYAWRRAGFYYNTDYRKRLTLELDGSWGGYYTGTLLNTGATLSYRAQPWGVFSVEARHNTLDLPAPYATTGLWLLSPKIDLTFTRSLFFTLYTQYNSQIQNLNLNARLQWRFAPMSDLFIVLTENYNDGLLRHPREMIIRDRAAVIKLTWWIGV